MEHMLEPYRVAFNGIVPIFINHSISISIFCNFNCESVHINFSPLPLTMLIQNGFKIKNTIWGEGKGFNLFILIVEKLQNFDKKEKER